MFKIKKKLLFNKCVLLVTLILVLISSMAFVSAEDVNGSDYVSENVLGSDSEEIPDYYYHEYVNWTLEVYNHGPDNATNVIVKDVLPSGFIYNFSVPSKGSFDETTGIWTVGDLNVGEGATLDIICWINRTGIVTNEANITSDIQDLNPNNNKDNETIHVMETADLVINKTVNNPNPNYGDVIVYNITVTNNGPDFAPYFLIRDYLDEGLYFYNGTAKGRDVTYWEFENLDVGQSKSILVYVYVNKTGHLGNRAIVDIGYISDWNETNNEIEIFIDVNKTADLEINKTVSPYYDGPIPQLLYAVKLKNNGPDNAENIVVKEVMDEGLVLSSYVPTAGYVDESNNEWLLDNLENGQEESLLVNTFAVKSGFIKNEVLAAASTFDYNEENNYDSQVVYIEEEDPEENSTVENGTSENMAAAGDLIEMKPTGVPVVVLILALICSVFSLKIKGKK